MRDIPQVAWWLVAAWLVLALVLAVRLRRFRRQGLAVHWGPAVGKLALRMAYVALVVLALAGPQGGSETVPVVSEGRDIMLAIDLSQSMDAADVSPSRLSRAKLVLGQLLPQLAGNRVALLIFAGEAYVQCPLTADMGAVQLFLESLHTNMIGAAGTDFAAALQLAEQKLSGQAAGETTAKVVVLVSDGEDFSGNARQQAQALPAQDIRLMTVGVGTQRGGTIPTRSGPLRDANGNAVQSQLNPQSLKVLAAQAQGRYFEIGPQTTALPELEEALDQLEGTQVQEDIVDVAADRYQWVLAVALLLFLVDVFLQPKVLRI